MNILQITDILKIVNVLKIVNILHLCRVVSKESCCPGYKRKGQGIGKEKVFLKSIIANETTITSPDMRSLVFSRLHQWGMYST